jgi:3-oxoacyl-[acyl-carrier protein] reductase
MNSTESYAAFASLSSVRAVVTGASTGIGRAIALEFARAGANLVIHCRQSIDKANEVAEECRQAGAKAEVAVADVQATEALPAFVEACWASPVDVWVNNAGADILTGNKARASFEEKLSHLYETDVRAALLLSRDVGRRMKARGRGVILNIGWDQADRGMEGDSGELFAMSKNAVAGFTRSLALSLAPEVRVNCVAPGWIRTAWGETASAAWQDRILRETPLKRWGTPEDIARTARFLCSPAAEYITGQTVMVNGGAVR